MEKYVEYIEGVNIVELSKALDTTIPKKKNIGSKLLYAVVISKILKKCLYDGMERKIDDSSISVWISHKRFVVEFSFLNLTVRTFENHLTDLKTAGIIRFTQVQTRRGSKSFYTFSEFGISLFSERYRDLYFKQIENWRSCEDVEPPPQS